MSTAGIVKVLPFDAKLGYPQRQRFVWNRAAYDIIYEWNQTSEMAVAKVYRVSDGELLWISCIVQGWAGDVKDENSEILMTLWFERITTKVAEVWIF